MKLGDSLMPATGTSLAPGGASCMEVSAAWEGVSVLRAGRMRILRQAVLPGVDNFGACIVCSFRLHNLPVCVEDSRAARAPTSCAPSRSCIAQKRMIEICA